VQVLWEGALMRVRCCSCRHLSWRVISRGWAVCPACYERRLSDEERFRAAMDEGYRWGLLAGHTQKDES
jgi:hypothetical protein